MKKVLDEIEILFFAALGAFWAGLLWSRGYEALVVGALAFAVLVIGGRTKNPNP